MKTLLTFICLVAFSAGVNSFNSKGFNVTLDELKDAKIGWKFSKAHPFHYFNHTEDIADHYLPVDIHLLPNAKGIWVLRYVDVSGPSQIFNPSPDETFHSFIEYTSQAQLFNKTTVKVLTNGDVELQLLSPEGNKRMSFLSGDHCEVTDSDPDADSVKDFQWIKCEVYHNQTSHMKLLVSIPHAHAFVILDEITLNQGYPDDKSKLEDPSDSEDKEKSEL